MLKLIYPTEAERWSDPKKPGNSICYPADNKVAILLRDKGLVGIEYRQCEPCFGYVAEATVSVDKVNSTARKADRRLAEYWNEIHKDDKSWKSRDVRKYRKQRALVWHRRWSAELMDLLPEAVHRHFTHSSARAYNKYVRSVLSAWELEDNGKRLRLCPSQNFIFITLLALLIRSFADRRIQGLEDCYLCFLAALLPYCVFLLLCRIVGKLPTFRYKRLCGLGLLCFFVGWTAFIPEIVSLKFMTPVLCCFSLLLAVYVAQVLDRFLSLDRLLARSSLRVEDEEDMCYDGESEDEE